MDSLVKKLARSTFIYWALAAILANVYFLKFDWQSFKTTPGSLVQKIFASTKFKNLNLGIDLQGGTHLVLKVDVEQAVDNRLAETGKAIEKLYKKNNMPLVGKGISNRVLSLKLNSADQAYSAAQLCKTNFPEVNVDQSENNVTISLAAGEIKKIQTQAVERSVEVLRTRLDTINVKGLTVNRHGDSAIVVQLPGIDNLVDIKDSIMRAARLEFRIVHDQAHSKDALYNKYDGILPSDKVVVRSKEEDRKVWYLVSLFPDVTGSKLSDARVGYDNNGATVTQFKLDSEGGREMSEVTGNNVGKQLAILMDGFVVSAPRVNSQIGREGIITGMNPAEAQKIAKLLRAGALDAPLRIEQENRVGASLGKDSISQGLTACLIALGLLCIFSMLYYKASGLLAMIALVFNLLLMLIMLAFFGATLTLTGIAGMVLTVGMAIDCSILIYEKIKEEMAQNVDFNRAVANGFNGASAVIIDSNITTFLAGVVLFWYGGPAVRGFAVTLMLGVVSTVIAGVYFLRSIFEFILRVFNVNKISI